MSPLALLSLLGLSLLLPLFMSDDDEDIVDEEEVVDPVDPTAPVDPVDPTDPVDPVDPTDPVDPIEPSDSLTGTNEADTLLTSGDAQTVNGFAGNDTITASETSTSSILNGGLDDDTFFIDGDGATANGERGDDTFEISGANVSANGATGDDSFSADGTNVSVSGGPGNDDVNYSAASGEVYGNIGDDTLIATQTGSDLSGSLLGNGGDDVLEAYDSEVAHGGVSLDGGDHNDTFNIDLSFTDDSTPEGEIRVATITDFNRGENTLNFSTGANEDSGLLFDGLELNVAEDGSYTDVIARYSSATSGVGDTLAIVRVEGVDDLNLDDINLVTGAFGTQGDDVLSSPGGLLDANDPDSGTETLSGFAGDDLLIHEARDSSGELVMQGGEGNDTLIANEVEFGNNTTLDGGAGDDLLHTDLFVTGTPGDSFDTFITGAGADTIEISFLDVSDSEDVDVGLMGTVTDFTPGEDMLLVDPSWLTRLSDADAAQGFTPELTLTEDPAGAFTDVGILVTSNANGNTFTATMRLEGLTGLTEDDIGFTLTDPADGVQARDGIVVGS